MPRNLPCSALYKLQDSSPSSAMSAPRSSCLILSLLLCCKLGGGDPTCKSLRDYKHEMPQEEFTGRWILIGSINDKLSSEYDFDFAWIDVNFATQPAQIHGVTGVNGIIKSDTYKAVEITKEDGSFILQVEGHDIITKIYPMSKNEILITWTSRQEPEIKWPVTLYSRSPEISIPMFEEFKRLGRCMGRIVNVYDNTINYAEVCDANSLKSLTPLDLTKVTRTWEEVAHIGRRRKEGGDEEERIGDKIEITSEEGKVIFKEKKHDKEEWETLKCEVSKAGLEIAKGSNTYMLTFYEICPGCLVVVSKRPQDEVTETIFHLYTLTGQVNKEDLEKFKVLAACEGFKSIHFNLGYVEDCDAAEQLTHKMTVNEFLGQKSLILNAYTSEAHAKLEPKFTLVLIDYDNQGEHLNGTYLLFYEGSLQVYKTIVYVTEENGVFYWRDAEMNVTVATYAVGDNCFMIMFPSHPASNNIEIMSFYCGLKPVFESEIQKFVQYAKCKGYSFPKIKWDHARQDLSCFDFPIEDIDIGEEKILGRWNYDAFASNIPAVDQQEGGWIQLDSQDGNIKYTDSLRHDLSMRLSRGKLYLLDDITKPVVTLYHISGEHLLAASQVGGHASFSLMSKSGGADAAHLNNFKHQANCLHLPVIYPKH